MSNHKSWITTTLTLMAKGLPERAKAIEPDLSKIAALGMATLERTEKIMANEHLSPKGKRDQLIQTLGKAGVTLKSWRERAESMTAGIEAARNEALAVPPQAEGVSRFASDEYLATAYAKVSPQVLAERYAQGLAGDARWHNVVRIVRAMRAEGVPLIEPVVQDLYDENALRQSGVAERIAASEEIQGFLAGITGTATQALRNAAKELGLESEFVRAVTEGYVPPPTTMDLSNPGGDK